MKNDPADMSPEEMIWHCVQISAPITKARKAIMEHGPVTAVNEDMYRRLKAAQREIDILRAMIEQARYRTINGEIANGYTFASYKITVGEYEAYYGHPNFGHERCHEQGQEEYRSLPMEECLVFLYDTPKSYICHGCGQPLLPESLRVSLEDRQAKKEIEEEK